MLAFTLRQRVSYFWQHSASGINDKSAFRLVNLDKRKQTAIKVNITDLGYAKVL